MAKVSTSQWLHLEVFRSMNISASSMVVIKVLGAGFIIAKGMDMFKGSACYK